MQVNYGARDNSFASVEPRFDERSSTNAKVPKSVVTID